MVHNMVLKGELNIAIDATETEILKIKPSDQPTDTLSHCHYVTLSILSLIRAGYICLEKNNIVSLNILMRSLIDYFCDLAFIVARNKRETNLLFAHYPILSNYWKSQNALKQGKGGLDQIAMGNAIQYARYIGRYRLMLESRAGFPPKKNGKNAAKGFDKLLRDLYKDHWSGFGRDVRMEYIAKAGVLSKDDISSYTLFFSLFSEYTHPSSRLHDCVFGADFDAASSVKLEVFLLSTFCLTITTFLRIPNCPRRQVIDDIVEDALSTGEKLPFYTLALRMGIPLSEIIEGLKEL